MKMKKLNWSHASLRKTHPHLLVVVDKVDYKTGETILDGNGQPRRRIDWFATFRGEGLRGAVEREKYFRHWTNKAERKAYKRKQRAEFRKRAA